MEVTPGHHEAEVRLTVEAMIDLINALHDTGSTNGTGAGTNTGVRDAASEDGGSGVHDDDRREAVDIRGILVDHGFTRAPAAPMEEIGRLEARLRALLPDLHQLPDTETDQAADRVNDALRTIPVEPWLIEHDGAPLHIHWTRAESTFDDQILGDLLMALAQELVDHGTARFGRCGAEDCDHLFYDTTRNHSRRFCADPRCASRTHTATHRARRRGA